MNDDERKVLADRLSEAVSDQLQAFLCKPADGGMLQRAVREATDRFLADLPEPDYLSIEFSDDPADVENLVLRGVIRIDPTKAPPEAMERWRRLIWSFRLRAVQRRDRDRRARL